MSKILFLASTVALLAGLVTAAYADIPVGLATATTGPVAALGEQTAIGAKQAIEDINAKGGVLGQKLSLTVGDDACDPRQAVSLANRFIAAGIKAVDGHLCSGSSIPASDVYSDENIVMVNPTATNPLLTDRGFSNVFRICGRDDQQGIVSGTWLAERYKGRNIAVIDDKQAYGKGLADVVVKTIEAKGGKVAYRDAITAGERDFSALISRLKEYKIDAVYYGGYHPELGLIVRQAREKGLGAQFIAGDGLNNAEFWAITGPAGQGTLYTDSPFMVNNPSAQQLTEAFRKTGHGDVGNFAYFSYAAIQIIADGIAKAGTAEGRKVADALHAGTFDTVVGQIQFDKKGDVLKPAYVLYEWKDGKNVELAGK